MSSMVVSFMAGGEVVHHDDRLIDLLGKGWAAWEQLSNGIRIEDPTRRSHLCRLARLGFLAPDIVTAILAGTQPVELTARSLLRANDLTVSWPDQRRLLGVELPQPGAKHRRIGEQDTNQPL